MKKIFLTAALFLAVLILVIAVFSLWISFQTGKHNRKNMSVVHDAEDAVLPEPGKGKIEGSLGYPSEFIPKMEVCAKKIDSKTIYCTLETLTDNRFKYKIGYELDVLPGKYQVYATLSGDAEIGGDKDQNYKAYYSEFVKCGMDVKCTSHKPISVTVEEGKTAKDIDPVDWYK